MTYPKNPESETQNSSSKSDSFLASRASLRHPPVLMLEPRLIIGSDQGKGVIHITFAVWGLAVTTWPRTLYLSARNTIGKYISEVFPKRPKYTGYCLPGSHPQDGPTMSFPAGRGYLKRNPLVELDNHPEAGPA